MVRAILDGRKAVTRRIIKPQPGRTAKFVTDNLLPETVEAGSGGVYCFRDGTVIGAPHQAGDILYVRETWAEVGGFSPQIGEFWQQYIYKATYKPNFDLDVPSIKWHPSIHMPKEAARLFLRVTGVQVERLQDITSEQIDAEGCKEYGYNAKTGELMPSSPTFFKISWDNTVKKSDLDRYGWKANPWVWVIEFERISKVEALKK